MTHQNTPDNADPINAIWDALSRVNDPEIRRPITELGMVQDVRVTADGTPEVDISLTIAGCPAAQKIESNVHDAAIQASGCLLYTSDAADE